MPGHWNEPDNKLNALVGNVHRIWRETGERRYRRRDGRAYERPGAGQLVFSDLGTIAVEASRGFSAYRWVRDELVRLGVPASEIAFMQDHKKSEAKQRLFNDFNAGKVRILIGSSETMGTGVNVQARLAALHHLDVPWLPSQIEQREGRIVRQGNQHDEVGLFAYATLGSLDATMWQNNERKARFIAAALSGDSSVRRLEDIGEGQANQFALAKAIASGDPRLMQKAGLEAEIARLDRLRAAHVDDQHAIRRQIRDAQGEIAHCERRTGELHEDLARHVPTQGIAFAMTVAGTSYDERKRAGQALMIRVLQLVQDRVDGRCPLGSIGGFEVSFHGRDLGDDGYHYDVTLDRSTEHEIDLPVTTTPLGAIARLEHALNGFAAELSAYEHRLVEAHRRLVAYEPRLGEAFPFAGELELKRAELAAIEADLAATTDVGEQQAHEPGGEDGKVRQAA
jgi:hypothetical protein